MFLKQNYWFSVFTKSISFRIRWGMQHPHKLNSPTTLAFCRKVDLKVIIVIMDIKKTTSFIKLGNAVKFTLGKCYFGYNYSKGNEEAFLKIMNTSTSFYSWLPQKQYVIIYTFLLTRGFQFIYMFYNLISTDISDK